MKPLAAGFAAAVTHSLTKGHQSPWALGFIRGVTGGHTWPRAGHAFAPAPDEAQALKGSTRRGFMFTRSAFGFKEPAASRIHHS